ncbi:MAG: polysaccharide deacetylase family protein [Clostridia bacterium]|nr:polysaccharide deacetylase family protein [Clostridia bacterium]
MKFRYLMLCVLTIMMLMSGAAGETARTPVVEFYIDHYVGHVGYETTVVLRCRTPEWISKDDNTFELRNQYGMVLAVSRWHNPGSNMTMRFTVQESFLGGNELSLWWNGVDVTKKHAWAAYSDLSVKRVTSLAPQTPAIALTIVCGDGDLQDVERILAVLEKHGVKCTFFLIGDWMESHVAESRLIVAGGHEIASHGYHHINMTKADYRNIRLNITLMNERCEELLGVRPRLFRAPYSATNEKVTALVRAEGMEEIQWSVDSQDWADKYSRHPEQIVQRLTDGVTAVSGSVVQFHVDGYNTEKILDDVIPYYRDVCGMAVVTVGELLSLSGRDLPPIADPCPTDD